MRLHTNWFTFLARQHKKHAQLFRTFRLIGASNMTGDRARGAFASIRGLHPAVTEYYLKELLRAWYPTVNLAKVGTCQRFLRLNQCRSLIWNH